MKLSDTSVKYLRHFADINPRLKFVQGNTQKTLSEDFSIFAEFVFPDEFPREFRIYDLARFIGNIESMDNPDIDFEETKCVIHDANCSVHYNYGAESLFKPLPRKALELDTCSIDFNLPVSKFGAINKIIAINGFEFVTFQARDGVLSVVGQNSEGSDNVTFELGNTEASDVEVFVKAESFKKFIPCDYTVEAQVDAFAIFTSTDKKMKYAVACDKGRKR